MKRLILLIVAVLLLAGGGSSCWMYSELGQSMTPNKSGQYIEIPRGSSPSSIVKKLADEGHYRK